MPEAAAWPLLQCRGPARMSHRGTAAQTAPAHLEAPARAHHAVSKLLTFAHRALRHADLPCVPWLD